MQYHDGTLIRYRENRRLCPKEMDRARLEALSFHERAALLSTRRFVYCRSLPINVLEETRRGYYGVCPKGVERFVPKRIARKGNSGTADEWVRLTQLHLHDEVSGRIGRKSVTYLALDKKLVEVHSS